MKYLPLIFLAVSALAASAVNKAECDEILQRIPGQPSMGTNPKPPAPLLNGAMLEMTADPAVFAAMKKFKKDEVEGDDEKVFGVLREKKALNCLLLSLCHRRDEVQSGALGALEALGDPAAVPFLLEYAGHASGIYIGSEGPTGRMMLHLRLSLTLSKLCGTNYWVRDQDPEAILNGIPIWRKAWLEKRAATPPQK